MIPAIVRTHCRTCEIKLTDSDDPAWGLCADCLEAKRQFWWSIYERPKDYEPPTGAVKYPNRDA